MILKNFQPIGTRGRSVLDREDLAEVDVETGFLFWKKTTRRAIRRYSAGYWHFVDTGEFTPGHQAERLERAYEASRALADLRKHLT